MEFGHANFPDLTSKARNRSFRREWISLFERHPPHFSTGVYSYESLDPFALKRALERGLKPIFAGALDERRRPQGVSPTPKN